MTSYPIISKLLFCDVITLGLLQGKTFLGVNCDSNDAKSVTLSSSKSGGKRKYTCTCEGTLSIGVSDMFCYIHYCECPT